MLREEECLCPQRAWHGGRAPSWYPATGLRTSARIAVQRQLELQYVAHDRMLADRRGEIMHKFVRAGIGKNEPPCPPPFLGTPLECSNLPVWESIGLCYLEAVEKPLGCSRGLSLQPAADQRGRSTPFNTWLLDIMQGKNQNRRLADLARIIHEASAASADTRL